MGAVMTYPPHYWSKDELIELDRAVKASDHGRKPVWCFGRYGRFRKGPSYTFHMDDIVTVDVDFELLTPPA